jgi:hypothetical protein
VRRVVARCRVGLLLLLLAPSSAHAWIYSEHRTTAARGIETLDPERRRALDTLWAAAREGYASRLCAAPAAGGQGKKPDCIDLAAWAAIAGDHSCSPEDMLAIVLRSGWILKVAAVASRTEAALAKAKNENERRNAQMTGDLGLERTDDDYSTRALGNNAHFLLPRSGSEPRQYIAESLKPGAEPNAMAIYVLFHAAALHRAAQLDDGSLPAAERPAAAREILALEFFGLHFLEDSFASGHIAGSWGSAAERKGTHDYYNEHGLEANNWKNDPMTLFGDGHMTTADLERADEAVRLSLAQVLEALDSGSRVHHEGAAISIPDDVSRGNFNVCKATQMAEWTVPDSLEPYLREVMLGMPVPFRGPGFASLPRFRAEIGPFIGVASGVSAESADGGFAVGRSGGVLGALDVGVRAGLGLDALLGDAGDGLVFLQGGIVMESRSSGGCAPNCPSDPLLQQFVPSIPARTGLSFRLRLPFWLIPGDLIAATPFLAFTNPKLLEKMAITAADGGLIPWQTKLATPVGRVQFVAGREVAVNLFGYVGDKNAFLAVTGQTADGRPVYEPIAVKSIEWDFPVLEIRPFREYGARYTFATFLQLGAGFDTPIQAQSLIPGVPPPTLKTRYFGYIRIFFDGRRYF